jgi:hypothetical protein
MSALRADRPPRVESLLDEDGLSAEDRPELIDLLKSDGTITEEEYSRERARILGEL